MNIAIIGSIGVGKTELFNLVVRKLGKGFHYVEDIDIHEAQPPKHFFEYMNAQELRLIERMNTIQWNSSFVIENIINDSSIFTELACMINGKGSNYTFSFPGNVKNNIDMLKNVSPVVMTAFDLLNEYDLLFYIPLDNKYSKTSRHGLSPIELDYRTVIDDTINYMLDNSNIEYKTIRGSVEDQEKVVLDTIKELIMTN